MATGRWTRLMSAFSFAHLLYNYMITTSSMKHSFATVALFSVALLGTLIFPTPTKAATLSFSATSTISVGDEFSLNVYASSTDRGFNAAQATVSFPKDILQIKSIDSSAAATIFNFWLALPEFSNTEGTAIFSGGSTHGLLGSDIPILTIHMRAVGSGDALITASDASINAADGNGTNILEQIIPARITVRPATVIVPPKPKPTPVPPPKPQPAPIIEPVQITQPEPASATATSTTESESCTGMFSYCDVRFPIIKSVSVMPRTNGSEILVSGTAPEGTHVHVTLRRYGDFYKEVIAVVEPNRTWEVALTNVYAYGVYSISARAETTENRASEPASWTDIRIFPPYSVTLFGAVLDWYVFVSLALGLLVLLLGIRYLRVHVLGLRFFSSKPGTQTKRLALSILIGTIIALLVMLVVSYVFLEQNNVQNVSFWKNSQIPCIQRVDSFDDTYGSAQLDVIVDGVPQIIPADIGISPSCVAQIHTHDDTGNLHFEATARNVTLTDLFTIAGMHDIQREGYSLSVTLNGEIYSGDISTYPIKNGDTIVLTYSKKK